MTRPGPGTRLLTFAEVTGLAAGGRGHFDAEVNHEWTIGGKPNGGYLLAMLGRAASSMSQHRHVIVASAHYLSSPDPGPVSIEAEVLRTGRSASHVRARMSQGDRACVEALITTGELDASTTPYWTGGTPIVSQVAYEDCPRLIPRLPNGARVAIMEQVEVRLEPGASGFTKGQPSGRGELRGWLSTLELTVYVRALPSPGPVRVLQRAQLIDAQRVDESCFIWDRTGRLVAHGSQLAGIRLGR